VCVLTGHGLKDPDAALAVSDAVERIAAETDAVEAALFG
jgi:threonine synthase